MDINRCAQECTASSIAVAEMLHLLESASLLDGTGWIDFFYLYHAMLVLCLNFLARPQLLRDEWTIQDREIHARVSAMIEMCQRHQLAPTYRILSKVAIQFSHIVGLASDHSQSRADSDVQASHGASVVGDGKAQEGANNHSNTATTVVAAQQQHDIFMPYTEPISGIAQFNDENAFWDFFNVNGLDPSDASVNLPMQYMPGTFEDPNAYSTWYGRPNDWPL